MSSPRVGNPRVVQLPIWHSNLQWVGAPFCDYCTVIEVPVIKHAALIDSASTFESWQVRTVASSKNYGSIVAHTAELLNCTSSLLHTLLRSIIRHLLAMCR